MLKKERLMKSKIAIVAIISALTAACAGGDRAQKLAQEEGKICKYEKTTGSHLGTRVCRTPEQIEQEKAAAKELIRTMRRSGPKDGSGG